MALTAVVHLLNNLFKFTLLGQHADRSIAVRFGLPAAVAAFGGALALGWLARQSPILRYELGGRALAVTPVALVIALVMALFAGLELWPRFRSLAIPARYLPWGGAVTGFIGGLSGHQGALRSAFLLRAGLSKEAFIATGVVIASGVDVVRLAVYSERFFAADLAQNGVLLAAAASTAFVGALFGNRLLTKVNLRTIEISVAVLLVLIALGIGSGLL